MTDYHESKLIGMIGLVNGSNREFSTPSKFVADSFRLIWNGQVYEASDGKWGWTETSDQTIELVTAPRTGDVLQGFYQDKDVSGQLGLDNVKGSPFHPSDLYT